MSSKGCIQLAFVILLSSCKSFMFYSFSGTHLLRDSLVGLQSTYRGPYLEHISGKNEFSIDLKEF